jgi:hypothetical protein
MGSVRWPPENVLTQLYRSPAPGVVILALTVLALAPFDP